jgi:hypothetical protein
VSNEEKILRKHRANLTTLQIEVWKDIDGYVGLYQISSYGRVKSLYKKPYLIMAPSVRHGYLFIRLYKDEKYKTHFIHKLIAKSFVPIIAGKNFVNHKDGNKQNNSIENLEWCTIQENNIHAFRTGLQKTKLTIDQVKEIRRLAPKTWVGKKQLSEVYSVHVSTVRDIMDNKIYKNV